MAAAGPAADEYAALLRPLGAGVDVVPGPVGAAATRKLLRSVFYKRMSAAVLEDWLGDLAARADASSTPDS